LTKDFMKDFLMAAVGITGSCIALAFGGWDTALQTLVIFMAIDFLSGLAVAGIFKKSKKSDTGALNSACSWQGLAKKGMLLFIVLVSYRLDLIIGSEFIRTAVIIAFISNELLSIAENAGLMGIPMPPALYRAIDILNSKGEVT